MLCVSNFKVMKKKKLPPGAAYRIINLQLGVRNSAITEN